MSKYVVVEALHTFRVVYIVESHDTDKVENAIHAGEVEEFGQLWMGEMVVSSRRAKKSEVVRLYDELFPGSDLSREEILSRIVRV